MRGAFFRPPICMRVTPTIVATATARSSASTSTCDQWKDITSWVEQHGGYISCCLSLVDDSPCKSRGVVATSTISLDEVKEFSNRYP